MNKGGERMRGTLSDQSSIYLQIAQMLEDDILRQVYREEEQVPSTNELARSFNINPATAAKGINLLVSGGILYKKRGIGMFVSKGAEEKVKENRRAAFYDGFVKPLVQEAKSIGLSAEQLQTMLEQAQSEGEKEE